MCAVLRIGIHYKMQRIIMKHLNMQHSINVPFVVAAPFIFAMFDFLSKKLLSGERNHKPFSYRGSRDHRYKNKHIECDCLCESILLRIEIVFVAAQYTQTKIQAHTAKH